MPQYEVKLVDLKHNEAEAKLNDLGAYGWELVTAVYRETEWKLQPAFLIFGKPSEGKRHVLSPFLNPIWSCVLKRPKG